MTEVAHRLVARNPRRLVLFDSAPLLASSEARAFINVPGQVILVARAGRTPRQALQAAIDQIDRKALHGVVINDAYITSNNAYYGYGYARQSEAGERDGGTE